MQINAKSFNSIAFVHNLLLKNDAVFDAGTGLHVHLDCCGIDRLVFIGIWLELLNEIYTIFPNRRNVENVAELLNVNDTFNEKLNTQQKLAMLLLSTDVDELVNNKDSELHFYSDNGFDFIEARIGGMLDEPIVSKCWTKILVMMVNEAKQYTDVLDYLQAGVKYSIDKLISRAPRKLKISETDKSDFFSDLIAIA
jgi:hypothetical protein